MPEIFQQILENALDEIEREWGDWAPMPSPENFRQIEGPQEAGVYQIRDRDRKELILFGSGNECRKRMKSLFPKPYGVGTRNNLEKRNFVLENWKELEYRTIETTCEEEAQAIEGLLKAKKNHRFNT